MKSKTAVIVKPNEIRFETRQTEKPGRDEVLVKTYAIGLCGSDLHLFAGSYKGPHQYPLVPGHEWAGEVIAVGDDVIGFEVGDKVTGEAAMWCGQCDICDKDKNICKSIEKRGLTIDGYATEYVVANQRHVYKIPMDMEYELACLTEPFAVGHHAIRKCMGDSPKSYADSKVLIMGAGPIGMGIAMLLIRGYGFTNVYISDLVEYRIKIAQNIGAKEYKMSISDTSAVLTYDDMYNIDGFDYIFESTGVNTVLDNAFIHVNPLGSVVMLAPIREIKLGGGLLVLKSVNLIGSLGGAGDLEKVIPILDKDKDYYKKIISHKFSFNELEKALNVQKTEPERMKIVINKITEED